MVRTERGRRAALHEHVDEGAEGGDDLRGGGEELEEQYPPHQSGKIGYWGFGEAGIIRRYCRIE